jgi:hypothetical protein
MSRRNLADGAVPATVKKLRCAVYTRKSTDEPPLQWPTFSPPCTARAGECGAGSAILVAVARRLPTTYIRPCDGLTRL